MKRATLLITLAISVLFMACEQGAEEPTLNIDVEEEATLESAFEDIDIISDASLEEIDTEGARRERDRILDCATVEHDTATNTVIIDYGDGCEGPGGRIRAGKIIIQYSGRRFEPGSSRVVTLEGFSLDGNRVEGTRSVTNISESLSDNPTFNVVLTGGKITFTDGTFATREANHTRTWFRARNVLEDSATVTGEALGINREGLEYSIEITETLVFKRTCSRVFIPVSGQKVITVGGSETIIDYGDGECENLVLVTRGGETTERTIRPKGRS